MTFKHRTLDYSNRIDFSRGEAMDEVADLAYSSHLAKDCGQHEELSRRYRSETD